MSSATLYFFPLSCARVAMVALEQTGLDYEVEIVNLMAHDQKSPDYLAINLVGKVPAVRIDGGVLTENVAIILYLAERFPKAMLLPATSDLLQVAAVRADLLWCATTMHPLIRQLRATHHYTLGDLAPVKQKAADLMAVEFERLEQRLDGRWWFGEQWSMVDAYLGWIISAFTSIGSDLSPFPGLVGYMDRLSRWPAYARMFAKEGELLVQAQIQLPPGVIR